MNIFIYDLILKINRILTYVFLSLYVLNLVLFYVTVILISIITFLNYCVLNFEINFLENALLLMFNPIYCMESENEPTNLISLTKESIPVDSIPSKFKTTVDPLIKYDSFKNIDNKVCINKYDYLHAIISDPDCTLLDLKKILSTNQIICLINSDLYHNEEMDSDLALSIRKELGSSLYEEELSDVDSYIRTQVDYKSKLAIQEYKSELASKYNKS